MSRSAVDATERERAVDRLLHAVGLVAGLAGAVALLALAAGRCPETLPAVAAYATGLMAMLSASAAYHLAVRSPRRELLRRLDHAAIFVMIAGTYTPFTVHSLEGAWSVGLTMVMWAAALAGVALKLALGRRFEGISIIAYLALGWVVVLPSETLLATLDVATVALLVAGGVLYTVGAGIYLWRRLPYHTAIWHGMVLLAAACHYAAIVHGVVLAMAA